MTKRRQQITFSYILYHCLTQLTDLLHAIVGSNPTGLGLSQVELSDWLGKGWFSSTRVPAKTLNNTRRGTPRFFLHHVELNRRYI